MGNAQVLIKYVILPVDLSELHMFYHKVIPIRFNIFKPDVAPSTMNLKQISY